MDSIFLRRSIRKYQNKPVEKEKTESLLRAAMQAPSSCNQQPWEFIVVQNKETLQKLSTMGPHSKMLAEAPLAIVLLANKERMKYAGNWEQDMGAATENLLLQAVELGLGAVWLGVTPVETRMQYLKEVFGLPDNIMTFAVVAVGYPAEENRFVDRFDESRIHYEVY